MLNAKPKPLVCGIILNAILLTLSAEAIPPGEAEDGAVSRARQLISLNNGEYVHSFITTSAPELQDVVCDQWLPNERWDRVEETLVQGGYLDDFVTFADNNLSMKFEALYNVIAPLSNYLSLNDMLALRRVSRGCHESVDNCIFLSQWLNSSENIPPWASDLLSITPEFLEEIEGTPFVKDVIEECFKNDKSEPTFGKVVKGFMVCTINSYAHEEFSPHQYDPTLIFRDDRGDSLHRLLSIAQQLESDLESFTLNDLQELKITHGEDPSFQEMLDRELKARRKLITTWLARKYATRHVKLVEGREEGSGYHQSTPSVLETLNRCHPAVFPVAQYYLGLFSRNFIDRYLFSYIFFTSHTLPAQLIQEPEIFATNLKSIIGNIWEVFKLNNGEFFNALDEENFSFERRFKYLLKRRFRDEIAFESFTASIIEIFYRFELPLEELKAVLETVLETEETPQSKLTSLLLYRIKLLLLHRPEIYSDLLDQSLLQEHEDNESLEQELEERINYICNVVPTSFAGDDLLLLIGRKRNTPGRKDSDACFEPDDQPSALEVLMSSPRPMYEVARFYLNREPNYPIDIVHLFWDGSLKKLNIEPNYPIDTERLFWDGSPKEKDKEANPLYPDDEPIMTTTETSADMLHSLIKKIWEICENAGCPQYFTNFVHKLIVSCYKAGKPLERAWAILHGMEGCEPHQIRMALFEMGLRLPGVDVSNMTTFCHMDGHGKNIEVIHFPTLIFDSVYGLISSEMNDEDIENYVKDKMHIFRLRSYTLLKWSFMVRCSLSNKVEYYLKFSDIRNKYKWRFKYNNFADIFDNPKFTSSIQKHEERRQAEAIQTIIERLSKEGEWEWNRGAY